MNNQASSVSAAADNLTNRNTSGSMVAGLRASGMRSIMITCPKTRRPIRTALMINQSDFATSNPSGEVACQHCGNSHIWSAKDAYLA